MELLLPRDFCDKQPKRWKKDASRRGATRAISKLEKSHAQRVAGKLRELTEDPMLERDRAARKRKASDRAAADKAVRERVDAEDATERALVKSSSMPIAATYDRPREAFWACELREGSALVVSIPADAVLTITAAVLVELAGGGAEDAAYALRCRTPVRREPAALCVLGGDAAGCGLECAQAALNVDFTADGDGKVALALEPCNPAAVEAAARRVATDATADANASKAAHVPRYASAHVSGVLRRGVRLPQPAQERRALAPDRVCHLSAGDGVAAKGVRAADKAAMAAAHAQEAARSEQQRGARAGDADGEECGRPTEPQQQRAEAAAAERSRPASERNQLKVAPARESSASGATVVELGDGLKVVDNSVGRERGGRRVAPGDKLTVRFQGLVHGPATSGKRPRAARDGDSDDEWKVRGGARRSTSAAPLLARSPPAAPRERPPRPLTRAARLPARLSASRCPPSRSLSAAPSPSSSALAR